MPRIADWPGRLREMAAFVGLDEDQFELIRSTAPAVLERADELTAAVYDNFLKHPGSRKFFLNEKGEVDETRLDRRKHSLARWLRASIDFKLDEDYPIRALATGIVHSHPPVHRAHLGSIPSRFMIGTMSFTQTALAELLLQEMDDPEAAMPERCLKKPLKLKKSVITRAPASQRKLGYLFLVDPGVTLVSFHAGSSTPQRLDIQVPP